MNTIYKNLVINETNGRKKALLKKLEEREKQIIQAETDLVAFGNKEALLIFQLMKETGIRLADIVDLKSGNLCGRELSVVERKYSSTKLYRYADGSKPIISEETAVRLSVREDGRFFTYNKNYYIAIFKKAFTDTTFHYYQIRRYALDKRSLLPEIAVK